MILGLAHVTLQTSFFAEAIGFFEKMGLTLKEKHSAIPTPLGTAKHDLALMDGMLPLEIIRGSREGLSQLAFYSTNIKKDTDYLVSIGATDPTGELMVTLGDRRVMVGMLRAPGGAIIELVRPLR